MPAQGTLSRAQKQTVLARVQGPGGCNKLAAGDQLPFHFAAMSNALDAQISEMSPEANLLVDQMEYAVTTTSTSADLASALVPVVVAAGSLSTTDADIINAAASVAQSSREYWEATITPEFISQQTQSIATSYGACFANYSDAATAVNSCMGIYHSRLVLPTGATAPYLNPQIHILFAQTASCNFINGTEIVHFDWGGAVAGGLGGFFITAGGGSAVAPGIIAGAILGAAVMSSGEMMWQMGLSTFCNLTKASGGRPKTT